MKNKGPSKIEAQANLTGDWKACTEAAWNNGFEMDWLGLEATLRAYVRDSRNTDVDKIVAAFTKRGNEI